MKSLRFKIAAGFVIIILINVAMVIFAVYQIQRLSRPIDRLLSEKYRNVTVAENMKLALAKQEAAQLAMIEEGFDSTFFYSFNTYKNEFFNGHQQAIEGIALPEEPEILDSLMFAFQRYLHWSDSLQKLIVHKRPYAQLKQFHARYILPQVKTIDSLCNALKNVNMQAINSANLKAQKISQKSTSIILMFSAFLVAISVLSSVYFARKILQPIRQTTETVKAISSGQLNQKVNIRTDDEIGQLAKEFNNMTSRLAAYERMNIEKIILEKKKSEAIISNIPAGLVLTDAQGQVILMNKWAQQLFGFTPENCRNQNVLNFLPGKILPTLFNGQTMKEEIQTELIRLTRGTEELFYEMRPITIFDDQGALQNVVILLQDVTRLKKLEQLKSDFMATISHELKTPLTSLNMTIDILLRQLQNSLNEQQSDLLHSAKHDLQRLKNFVNELREYARLASEKYEPVWQTFHLQELLDEALQPFTQTITRNQITLTIETDPQVSEIEGEFRNLTRVLSNILQNALEHVPPKGHITLRVQKVGPRVRFSIADDGPGIPLESQKIIFEKFVRLTQFEKAKDGNMGLGLAIAREIVTRHHGKIWVESTPGQGSTFIFEIPITQTEETTHGNVNV